MTAAEFRTALLSLELRQSWLAERLGVSDTTVNRWVNGKVPVPGYAVFAVELLADLDILAKALRSPPAHL